MISFPYPYPENSAANNDEKGFYFHNLNQDNKQALETVEQWVMDNNIDLSDLCLTSLDHRLTLLRYLRSYLFDVDRVIESIQSSIEWRKQIGLKELVRKTPEEILGFDISELTSNYIHWHYGYDKEGRPVLYKKYTECDATKLKEIGGGDFEKIIKYHVWEHEVCAQLCLNQSYRLKKTIETVTVVVDIGGMRISQITKDFLSLFKSISNIDQNQYPETMGQTLIINAPSLFPFVYNMVKPYLNPSTVKKIRVLSGSTSYFPVLDELIGLESLPGDYGGKGPMLGSLKHPYGEAMGNNEDILYVGI